MLEVSGEFGDLHLVSRLVREAIPPRKLIARPRGVLRKATRPGDPLLAVKVL